MATERQGVEAVEQRISALEEDSANRYDSIVERQLKTITVVFSLVSAVIVVVGLLITGLSIFAKIEVSTAVREMERRFELLAGQALKAPVLRILYEGAELNQRQLNIRVDAAGNFRLNELYLTNTGDRHTETLSIRLQFNHPVVEGQSMYWQKTPSSDPEFVASFWWAAVNTQISPRETWNTSPFFGRIPGVPGDAPREIRAKVFAFYGREQPAEATFTIRLTK